MVESAWRGKDDLWKDVIKDCPRELIEIVDYFKERDIPTLFWNKEDPYHFDDFVEVAALFDFVFTTDIECIPLYKKRLNHKNIFLLPFACQPKIHNPIEKYERKEAFVFAGAYYNRFTERNEQFSKMVEALDSIGKVDIYDRNYDNKKTAFKFPEKYHRFIRGGLSYDEIDIAYKGYKYAINLNSMTESPTMFSRRVFELMASNTMVLSNYAVGMDLLLGELTIATDSVKELKRRVDLMVKEPLLEKKIRLAALRKVMQEHTAQDRMEEMVSHVLGHSKEDKLLYVTCIAYAKDEKQIQHIQKVFLSQNYNNKRLIIVCRENLAPCCAEDKDIIYFEEGEGQKNIDYFYQADYIAGFSVDDYYGKNYLMDLVLATQYADTMIISKGGNYIHSEKNGLQYKEDRFPYKYTTSSSIRSSLIHRSKLNQFDMVSFSKSIDTNLFTDASILAIDEFNYCMNGAENSFGRDEAIVVDDLQDIDSGIVIDDKWVEKQIRITERQIKSKQDLMMQYAQKQEEGIGSLEKEVSLSKDRFDQLSQLLHKMVSISFVKSPAQKIQSYKQLIDLWQKLSSDR